MNQNRLTKQIFDFFMNRQKPKTNWFKNALEELSIHEQGILDRHKMRNIMKIEKRRFQEKLAARRGVEMSEENKTVFSKRMK